MPSSSVSVCSVYLCALFMPNISSSLWFSFSQCYFTDHHQFEWMSVSGMLQIIINMSECLSVLCCRSSLIWVLRSVYTIQPCTMPLHFIQSHIRKLYACLFVTCQLHFAQKERDLSCATAVTRGWNGYRWMNEMVVLMLWYIQLLRPDTL